MARKHGASRRRVARCLSAGAMIGIGCLMSACERGGPLQADVARAPAGPSRLLNPLCTSTGTPHASDSVSTSVTWQASGNPHQVTGTVALLPGGFLTLEAGTVVCFAPGTGVRSTGGRLVTRGEGAAPVVLTAYDPAQGWDGVELQGTPTNPSMLIHARVEYVSLNSIAVVSTGHRVNIDTSVIRQSGAAVSLAGRSSWFEASRVDTTTNRYAPAITLGDSGRFVRSVILGAAGTGLLVDGTAGVRVTGGRIEASGGVGIVAPHETGINSPSPVRVVGGLSYPIETTAALLERLYGSTAAEQDSLKGNARDTVIMLGGTLQAPLHVRAGLPWHVKAPITVLAGGVLNGRGGSLLVLDTAVYIATASGGRVQLRGAPGDPVVLTADDPARGWRGIDLTSTAALTSYITSAVVEHVADSYHAVDDFGVHRVRLDSVVLRQNGSAVRLTASGSRLIRSRVDTTLTQFFPAVELGADAVLESTLVRGASGVGVAIDSDSVQVVSCEVRGSAGFGILLYEPAPVHNCNLVDNLQDGVWNVDFTTTADATNNWWGDAGGPFGPNGDGVSIAVNYTPWRTTPYVLPYVP